jgi:hypothetical protein
LIRENFSFQGTELHVRHDECRSVRIADATPGDSKLAQKNSSLASSALLR